MSSGLETEVKYRIASWEEGEERLGSGGARIRRPRYFEKNVLFDFPQHHLEKRGEALRLRTARGRTWLTFKGPVHGTGRIKQRKEYETILDDVNAAEEILHALGLSECFLYEKYRADYVLEGLVVSLDEAPMGYFLELEGPPAEIEAGTRKLELRLQDAISLTYPRLYQLFRDEVPDAPEFMVFSAGKDTP